MEAMPSPTPPFLNLLVDAAEYRPNSEFLEVPMRSLRALPLLLAYPLWALGGDQAKEEVRPLAQGKTVTRTLKGGEGHRYSLALDRGQFAKVVALQKGVDLVLTSLAPNGSKLAEVDSPNGTEGPETVDILAKEAGTYTLMVQSLEAKAEPGDYDLRIETFMTAEEFEREGVIQGSLPDLLACGGAFELEPGHRVSVGVLEEFGTLLIYSDHRTGRVGALHPHSPTEYFLGQTLLSPKPLEARLRFLRGSDGQVNALALTDASGKTRTARRIGPGHTEEIVFQHDGLTLKGVLHLPPGKGPFPAMVYAHGSGPATRHIGHYPTWFTAQGFAVLAFDKRGAGQSQGDWRTASFHALAGDVLAGLSLLKARKDIDPGRLGIFGISQGGWVGSLAASKSKDVKFFLGIVGSGVPVWENVAHECTSVMKTLGLPDGELQEGQAFALKAFRMAADGATAEQVRAEAAPHKGKRWLKAIWLLDLPPANPWWTWWKLNGHIDPQEILPKVACPVLWVLGDRDSQVPTAQSEPRIRKALARNKDAHIKVFPRAGHPLFECETGLRDEIPTLSRYVPGYYDTVEAWLKVRAGR